MVEAINHDGGSSLGTVATSTAKFSLIGAIGGGLLTFGAIVLGAGLVGAVLPGATFAGMAGLVLGGSQTLTAAAAIASVVMGGANIGLGALVGGLFGLAKGSDKVSAEKAAYRSKEYALTHSREQQMMVSGNNGEIRGVQQGYTMAMQDAQAQLQAAYQQGQQDVVKQLQEHAMQQQAMMGAHGHQTVAHAKAEATAICGPHTDKIVKEKATAAAAVKQM